MTTPAFRDAAFVTTFSVMGGGRTTDCVASFPRNLVFAMSRELKSPITVLGYHPQIVQVRHIYDVTVKARELLTLRAKKDKNALYYTGVTVDDMTIMAYRTEQAIRTGTEGVPKEKGWDIWTEQRCGALEIAIKLAEECKQEGLHFVVNGHERPAKTNNAGKFIRGGIDLATDLAETFSANCDLVAKVMPEEERLWQRTVFFVKSFDSGWATKNRFSLPDKVPSNMGEILRAAGYVLPRPVGMEKHEEYVEWLAGYLGTTFATGAAMTKAALQPVLAEPMKQLSSAIENPLHVRWIVRDAVDRAWLRREQRRSIFAEVGVGL